MNIQLVNKAVEHLISSAPVLGKERKRREGGGGGGTLTSSRKNWAEFCGWRERVMHECIAQFVPLHVISIKSIIGNNEPLYFIFYNNCGFRSRHKHHPGSLCRFPARARHNSFQSPYPMDFQGPPFYGPVPHSSHPPTNFHRFELFEKGSRCGEKSFSKTYLAIYWMNFEEPDVTIHSPLFENTKDGHVEKYLVEHMLLHLSVVSKDRLKSITIMQNASPCWE